MQLQKIDIKFLFSIINEKRVYEMNTTAPPSFPPGYVEENIGGSTIAVAVAFAVLEITFVALRFASRWISKTRVGIDDMFIPPALLFCLGLCALAIGKR